MLVTLCYNLVHDRVPVRFPVVDQEDLVYLGITCLEKVSCLLVIVHHVQNVFMINI